MRHGCFKFCFFIKDFLSKTVRWKSTLMLMLLWLGFMPQLEAAEENKYLAMSLSELLNVEVNSVSRKDELLRHAGAAVFVISAEDIRRSGASSIPEALRMVPGVNVARINANEWAVSARGFNGRFANKLLVQIDGRSVYSPLFAGVYWDVQDTLLEDVERIEVIRGPGATLWGSNAVNGIINVITKKAIDAQGGLWVARAGSQENIGALRYGGAMGDRTFAKAYVKYKKQKDLADNLTAAPAGDSWDSLGGGFRIDSELSSADVFTVQGDIYHNNGNQFIAQMTQATPPYVGAVQDKFKASGWNTLARWEHDLGGDDTTSLQFYVDHTKRDEAYIGQQYDVFDIDFQHHFDLGDMQQLVWGLGYRNIREKIRNTFAISLLAPNAGNAVISGFLQDDIRLGSDDLHLIVGSKFERNDFTGWEVQPNARMTWSIDDEQTLWGAISKAVHTPSRADNYGQAVIAVVPPLPPFIPVAVPVLAKGTTNVQSESLIAYELGYRTQLDESFNLDIATFYNVYDKLRTFDQTALTTIEVGNNIKGFSYGLEVAADWQATSLWQLRLAYSYINIKLDTISGRPDPTSITAAEGSSPKQQVSLRSHMSLFSNVELDIWGRYNSQLYHDNADNVVAGTQPAAAYTEMDVRLAWQANENLEVAVLGQNLLHARHIEFIQETSIQFIRPTAVERSIAGTITLAF